MLKKIIFIILAVALVFAFTACGSADNTAGQSQERFRDDGSIRGIVMAVSDTKIEIAKMDFGSRQNGNSQNPPSQPSGSAPQGSPDASGRPAQSFDTSKMEKAQYTIDSATKIVKQTFSGGGQGNGQDSGSRQVTETTAGISDIQQGIMVSITLKEGSTATAAKIVITEGFGGRGNRNQNSSGAA